MQETQILIGSQSVLHFVSQIFEMNEANKIDPHSMDKERINGVLCNMDGWYDAYDIQPGDKLYQAPDKRVRIW